MSTALIIIIVPTKNTEINLPLSWAEENGRLCILLQSSRHDGALHHFLPVMKHCRVHDTDANFFTRASFHFTFIFLDRRFLILIRSQETDEFARVTNGVI